MKKGSQHVFFKFIEIQIMEITQKKSFPKFRKYIILLFSAATYFWPVFLSPNVLRRFP